MTLVLAKSESLLKSLQKLHDNFEKAVQVSLTKSAQMVVDEAKLTTVFKGNSKGGLRDSIKVIPNGSLARSAIADKFYAYYVEFGNNQKGPYIYPVRAKALRFYLNGELVFRKRVRSHGPLPFMYPAYLKVKPNIIPGINAVMSNLIRVSK